MRTFLLCAVLAIAGCAGPTTISTGMTEAEIEARLGRSPSRYESTASTTKRLNYDGFTVVLRDGVVTEIISYD